MANSQGAKKALRSSARRRDFNDRRKRVMKEAIKEVRKLVKAGDIATAKAKLPQAYKAIDKAARRFLHKNTAARYKSRLTKLVQKAEE